MQPPSSTSSSDADRPRATLPAGALFALALLLLFELCVARSEWFATVPEVSNVGEFAAVERELVATLPNPRIVAVGSSRVHYAVVPSVIEERLSLPPGSVANLALSAGTPVDALALWRRNREWFGRAEILVIGVEDWYPLGSRDFTERERRFTSIGTALAEARSVRDAVDEVAQRLCRTLAARRRIGGLIASPWRLATRFHVEPGGPVLQSPPPAGPGGEHLRVDGDVTLYYGQNARPKRFRMDALEVLIGEARAAGLEVVVLQLPWREEYLQAVQERHGDQWEHYKRSLREMIAGHPEVHWYVADHASEVGLSQTDFCDYGHFVVEGGRSYSARLVDEVLRDL